MMRYFIAILICMCLSECASASVTEKDVREVYKKILDNNLIIFRPPLYIEDNDDINAYTDGKEIVIYTGLMKAVNKQQLALVIGHELAHYKLWHNGSNWHNEFEADEYGAIFAKTAGFDVCKGRTLFKLFKSGFSLTHPPSMSRYVRVGKQFSCKN